MESSFAFDYLEEFKDVVLATLEFVVINLFI